MPLAYSKYEYKVEKQGCYYEYWEEKLPHTLHLSRRFMLNRFGAIVGILGSHGIEIEFKCPEKVYSESELTEIIKKQRELRQDLPPPFSNNKVQSIRYSCLYLYIEEELPKGSKNYLVFEIDPFGELMKFSRHERVSQKSSGK